MFDIKNYKTFFIEQNTQNAQIFTSFVNRNDSRCMHKEFTTRREKIFNRFKCPLRFIVTHPIDQFRAYETPYHSK